ncbi:MAG TPA: UDP-N-acetylglucosamine 1-carboxyvinyltransferase [Acidimicrobiales bacterium]|nr:UDP-N-acetylglucosamine 1-carboxyvinyltransferase [Acidimicrobiales bacterium]
MADSTIWAVEPSGPLHGEVVVGGSKNAVTKLMAAALLADSPSWVTNAPAIGDVDITAAMLGSLGVGVAVEGGTVSLDPRSLTDSRVPVGYSGLNRIPILLLGPLLHALGEATVPLAGGDLIGSRPLDFHLQALRTLGAEVELTATGITAKTTGLRGARIRLPFPSVGATETVLLSAARAEGRTVLENAAIEPEVVELALFLQRLGVGIELRTDRRFVIEGKPRLSGARQRLGGDRIEAFSYLVAALATGGSVKVVGCAHDRLVTAVATLQRMGATFEIGDDDILVRADDGLRPIAVATSPHPGFMTDWQSPLVVLFTQTDGLSVMHETVFEDRLGYVGALQEMGARIQLFDQCLVGEACRFHEGSYLHSVVVQGRSALSGADLKMPDIRAGFAYLLAAATASGPSRITGVHQLERGYDRVLEKFQSLGLDVRPIT